MPELPEQFGEFVLLKRIGSGGMGDAFLARRVSHHDGDRPLVIKRMHRSLVDDDGVSKKRFLHEGEIAKTVDSRHVAKVFEVGWVQDVSYLAMEYVEGWPLQHLLYELDKDQATISINNAVEITAGLLVGLDALHTARDARGEGMLVVHRDVSPKNIIISKSGIAVLIDLGIAGSIHQEWKTKTGMVLGTPGYMAPEQIRGQAVDRRADLFAAALVLYELLALRPLIPRGTVHEMLGMLARGEYLPIRLDRPDAAPIKPLLEQMLHPSPAERLATADAFLVALRRIVPERASHEAIKTLINSRLLVAAEEREADVTRLLTLESTAAIAPPFVAPFVAPFVPPFVAPFVPPFMQPVVPPLAAPKRAPKRRVPAARMFVAASVVIAAIIVAFAVFTGQNKEAEETVEGPKVTSIRETPRVEARPRAEQTEISNRNVEELAPRAPRAPRVKDAPRDERSIDREPIVREPNREEDAPVKTVEAQPAAEPTPAPPPATPDAAHVRALMDRCHALRPRTSAQNKKEVAQLCAALSFAAASIQSGRSASSLSTLESELVRLEAMRSVE